MVEIFPDGSITYIEGNKLMFKHRSGKIIEIESFQSTNDIYVDCDLYNDRYYIVTKSDDRIGIHILDENLRESWYTLDGKDVVDMFIYEKLLLLITKNFIQLFNMDDRKENDRYGFDKNFYDKEYDTCSFAYGYLAIRFNSDIYKCLNCKKSFTEPRVILSSKLYDKSEIIKVCPHCGGGNYSKKSRDEILIVRIGFCEGCNVYRFSENNLCRYCNSELKFEDEFKKTYYDELVEFFKVFNINKQEIYKFLSKYVNEESVEKIMNLSPNISLEIIKYYLKEENNFKKKFNVLVKILSNCDSIIYKGINIKDYIIEALDYKVVKNV